ncbi:MAG TPA: hypothetical protein VNB22_22170 [Pyrinomonadaceae bacterium]|nr:hypothetical protein [Pyrinomonadaceae bacterium]
MQSSENRQIVLQNLLDAHHEWLLIYPAGRSFAFQKGEIELNFERGKLLLGFLDDKGFQTWRVADFQTKNNEINLNLTRNFEKERAKIRLVPRALAKDLSASVELARLEKANKIAQIIKETFPQIKLVRTELNKENGRFAQIVFENQSGKRIEALADVSENLTPEILLSTAILRLVKLQNRKKNPVETIWIVGEKKQAGKLQKLHALLREDWKPKILIKEISRQDAKAQNEELVKDLPSLQIQDLWRGRASEIKTAENGELSETARKIIEFSPAEIDAVFSKHGETLRFNGLPFARVRRIFDQEKVWFGVERSRQILSENNFDELLELIENLRSFRRSDAPNKRHALFQTAPEAWLEAVLRRNIKLLDANLILSPLYQQFRAERERIDLLALRRDGRLVIIELKTAPDREMIFQTADYWRKLELQRRKGNLQKARLFGDARISDAPAICYLAAPTLAFHRDLDFLASTITPEIEIHRFNLAENWRENLKVFERREVFKKNLGI